MTEGPCVNFVMREALFEIYTWILCLSYLHEKQTCRIQFYLFVSHGGMNDRGSMCKFRNARSAFRNLHVDPLSFILP